MKNNLKEKKLKIERRHRRIRAKIKGTSKRPRLLVFRSNRHIYGQLIDDEKSKTLASAKDSEIKSKKMKKGDLAKEVGKLLAKKALEIKIEEIVFDRRGYKFHGRIKQLAEGAREGGLKF
jgi:large subunit ribosomal protein L18